MFILTQLTAAGGAFGFGVLQDRIGARRTFQITLGLWIVCILGIWQVEALTQLLNATVGAQWKAEHVFLGLGGMAGLGIGSTQSASRAMVGVLSPQAKAGEFFGFWGLAGKLAAIAGLLSFGLLQTQRGLRGAIPLCALLFGAALLVSIGVNERRSRETADGANSSVVQN
jgi:UMF1 family MFS transporter